MPHFQKVQVAVEEAQQKRVRELEAEVAKLRAESIQASEHASTQTNRAMALEVDRQYLWTALAQLEAWAATAPREDVGRVMAARLKAALDGFQPALKVTREAP